MGAYLRPKSIEHFNQRSIYEYLGIRYFKKFLPTTGDLARKSKKIVQIELKNGKIDELYKYERQTRVYELRHLAGALMYIILFFIFTDFSDSSRTGIRWTGIILFNTFLNAIINIYPIFLQRYNRYRIIAILTKYGYKNPYDA